MNFGLFLMIVVGVGFIFMMKKIYYAMQRAQKQMDFEEYCKNEQLNKTLTKGKKK